jgi:hypothetical protein
LQRKSKIKGEKRMKASEYAKLLIDAVAEHGDGELIVNGTGGKVTGIIFSDEENVPDASTKPWFEITHE